MARKERGNRAQRRASTSNTTIEATVGCYGPLGETHKCGLEQNMHILHFA